MTSNTNITGRDDFILTQALYVAARALRSQEYPEWSNADDMEEICEAVFPGQFDWWRAQDLMEEGLRRGLQMPVGGLMMDSRSVEKWIDEGGATDTGPEGEGVAEAYLAAHATAFTMNGHLNGLNRISGLSEDDARMKLSEALATMARLVPSPAELIREAVAQAAA